MSSEMGRMATIATVMVPMWLVLWVVRNTGWLKEPVYWGYVFLIVMAEVLIQMSLLALIGWLRMGLSRPSLI
ncbi:hypothetical protein SDC9_158373 [bioreactor metagenome]|uniref:Uncharacterized protein n=1 Tax=bioreactor metagenome TaxID=1076179 RepID=A0A645FBX6_9ZZZZ